MRAATPATLPSHLAGDVGVEGIPVLCVQLLRVVVGGLLGAHIVNDAARMDGQHANTCVSSVGGRLKRGRACKEGDSTLPECSATTHV